MIYVFMVDTGTMLTFDMNLALESVSVLKGAIHRNTRTPPDKQVLLASGGLALEEGQKVCFYPAGTDTNPIFLFSKSAIEGNAPPTPPTPPDMEGGELNLKAQVEGCLNMPATYNTVVSRTQLAQQFYECARDITRSCTHLVHDQHLQQQGWAAVVANLEDIVQAFKSKFESLKLSFSDYLNGREEKVTLLQCFEEDLKLLARIPVFPELLGRTEEEKRTSEEQEEEEEEEEEVKKKKKKEEEEEEDKEDEEEGKEKGQEEEETARGIGGGRGRKKITPQISLLDWISAKDRQSDVRQVAELCFRGLSQISEGLLEGLSTEVVSVMREADRPEMKEVKGLEERLCGLEQLMHDAEFVVQEQHNFSQALLKNQDRAGKVNDPSIFPDLCTSHRKNLMHMLRNHQKLQDIKRRCIKAKEELSENLHVRLKWIMYIERKLYEADTRIAMHQENVRRLLGYLQVVEQIHRAPRVYAAAITEVARRQAFSKGFLKWASQLSSESGEVWRKEVEIRRLFYQEFSTHFLASLFPGMEDLPPDFATRLPDRFDLALPKVTEENIEQLRLLLPELSNYLVVGNVVAVPPLLQHLYKGTKDEAMGRETCEGTRAAVKNKLPQTIHELSKHIRLDQQSPGPQEEEEEEEEEEEGGGRGGGTGGGLFSPPLPPLLSNAGEREDVVSLQMELRAAKVEVDRLKSRLGQLGDLKLQVNALKTEVQSEGSSYMDYLSQVSSSVVSLLVQSQEQTDSELQRAHVQLADAHRRIKTYTAQLEDAHRELEVYMEQLQEKSGQIEEMRERGKEERKRKEEEEEEEKLRQREEIQRLQLDHEVEVATLRQTLATLQEAASGVEEEAEERIRARVQEERERIERALEATFIDRERSSIERLERELRERLEREREAAREEERIRARAEMERERENRARERERELEEVRREKDEEMERKLREEIEVERSKHRSELDSIRSRFKIMTTTTTASSPPSSSPSSFPPSSFPPSSSPTPTPFDPPPPSSPTSRWEGIERLREEIEREKEREIRERLAQVREEERRKAEEEKQMEFTEELERIKRDKERVIEDLNIRIKLLMEEVDRRRGGGGMGLQEEEEEDLGGGGGGGLMEENADLKAQVDRLRGQITSLENELSRAKRFSFISQPSTTTATTTTTAAAAAATTTSSMTSSEIRDRQVATTDGVKLGACYPGDHVLIAYDTRHNHYRIILEQNVYLHFVHTDSYNALGISKDNPQQKLYCAAEVISKEFCQAKKDDNRFRVPKGTRFYRVVVKPWDGSSSSSSSAAAATTTTSTTTSASTTTSTT